MNDLVFAFRLQISQETEVVLEMFEDVHEQHQVEMHAFLASNVRIRETESLIRSALTECKGLWRDLISQECAVFGHALLHEPQNLSDPTSHIANPLGRNPVSLQES